MRYLRAILLFLFLHQNAHSAEREMLYFVDYGIHTAIILPYQLLAPQRPDLFQRFEGASYIELSIGEDPFFRRSEHSKMDIVRALFWSTPSIIRIHPIREEPLKHYTKVASVAQMELEHEKALKLAEFVLQSFQPPETKDLWVETQVEKDRHFVKAIPSYHLLNNCNDWTSRMFATIGIETHLTSKFSSADLFDDIISKSKTGEKINFTNDKYLKYLR